MGKTYRKNDEFREKTKDLKKNRRHPRPWWEEDAIWQVPPKYFSKEEK